MANTGAPGPDHIGRPKPLGDSLRDRQQAAFTEHALWKIAAERVARIINEAPDLTGRQVFERLRAEEWKTLTEHRRLMGLEPPSDSS